ncbi:MAG: ComF family protein [Clostridia bacterium]|nr:ComF family protein [Clostridia bacterium]
MKAVLRPCPICGNPPQAPDFLCKNCREKVEAYNRLPKCAICGQPKGMTFLCNHCSEKKPSFTLAASCYHYDGAFRQAMLNYKFHGEFYRAKGLSRLLLEQLEKMKLEIDCITAVPVGPKTYWKQKYNAPLELAYLVAKKLKLPCYPNLLLKKWFAKRQSTLKASQRKTNVKGNFYFCRPYARKIKGKHILLLDDVFTTGSTANECSRILKKHGAASVYILTLLGNASKET